MLHKEDRELLEVRNAKICENDKDLEGMKIGFDLEAAINSIKDEDIERLFLEMGYKPLKHSDTKRQTKQVDDGNE